MNTNIHRRNFLLSTAALAAGLSPLGRLLAAGKPLTVGFIYVGPRDDFGYNQAHAEGAAALKAMDGLQILEEENVPETIEVQKTMASMIQLDDAGLLFPTSFGYYDPHVLEVAPKYPKVNFLHSGGLYSKGDPGNAGSYFGYIDEAQYVAGVVAGHGTRSNKLGFVAAKPIPQVLRNINSFTLGARSVNPEATTQVVFTGDWAEPVKEAESTNSLADQGVDVVTCHVDSPKVVAETCKRRKIFYSGYHANQAPLIPEGYLTGAEWNWAAVYPQFVEWHRQGTLFEKAGHMYRGGLAEGLVKLSAYGSPVSDKAAKAADSATERLIAGDLTIYAGPIKDNRGHTVIPQGKTYTKTDVWLEKMDWLVAGVKGSTRA
jgi:simple sugar transport system substrate-binding protein